LLVIGLHRLPPPYSSSENAVGDTAKMCEPGRNRMPFGCSIGLESEVIAMPEHAPILTPAGPSDEELIREVLGGNKATFELLMRRNNQRVYRACRAILRDDTEAEDVAQEAWVRAYEHLGQFAGRSSFSTWITRIAVNEALLRTHRKARNEEMDAMPQPRRDALEQTSSRFADQETAVSATETRALLERAIDGLPVAYRQVFVLREVEDMSTADTAEALGISNENVKTRLLRARALLRRELYARAGATSSAAFSFMGARCDRLVKNVMARLQALP
jgi:RNA polymerase sigma-70 factor (ECF subfamily)